MQPNELKALLAQTNEVAMRFAHVEISIDNPRAARWQRRPGQIWCPTGLIKGKVLEDGVKWVEKRPLSVCGDQDYEIQRRNGVLVEIDPADLPKNANVKIKGKNVYGGRYQAGTTPYPHTTVVTRERKKYIHLITSRKAIFSSWGEYAMEMAKREKQNQEEQERRNQLRRPQAALMGFADDLEFYDKPEVKQKYGYLGAEWDTIYEYDDDGNVVKDKDGQHKKFHVGVIQLPIEQAEKILAMLTPKQRKALSND